MAGRVLVIYSSKVIAVTESNSHKQQSSNLPQISTQKNKVLTGSHVLWLSVNPFCLRGMGSFDLTLFSETRIKILKRRGLANGDRKYLFIMQIYNLLKFISNELTSSGSHKTVFADRSHWQPWGGMWRVTELTGRAFTAVSLGEDCQRGKHIWGKQCRKLIPWSLEIVSLL